MRAAVAAIARPTFDVDLAAETATQAGRALADAGVDIAGDTTLLMDEDAVRAASTAWGEVDALIVLQATFADSTLVTAAADASPAPLHLWGFPEDRTGGRLRLNSLCGINLAAFTLRNAGRDYRYAYGPPDPETVAVLLAEPPPPPPAGEAPAATDEAEASARRVMARLGEARIGVIGDHPDGFEPCAYDPGRLASLGPVADRVELDDLFAVAGSAGPDTVAGVRARAEADLGDLSSLDQSALEQSLRIGAGLQQLAADRSWSAVATRCWPECFTEFGGAVCSPHAMLGDRGIPGMCEADVYGGLTALILDELTGRPGFVADLVEISGDTAVFWHCGNAPVSLAGTDPRPTVHSNRRLPLLGEFLLQPGPMTVCRVSQSSGRHRLVIGLVEALEAPLPFSGTSAVVRLPHPILPTIMAEGLEHHYGLAYGDVTLELHALAGLLELDVVTL